MKKLLPRSKNILIGAHRGASAYAPENTLAAFEKALELHADYIELDVQISKDGHCIVIHDNTVDRTTNGKGFVFDKTLKELKSLDGGSWFDKRFRGERIPTLADVLEWAKRNNIPLQIEIKQLQPYHNYGRYKRIETTIVKTLKNFGLVDHVWITSFDELSLKKVKEIEPKFTTAIITGGGALINPFMLVERTRVGGIHLWWEGVSKELVLKFHSKGYYVSAWGIDKETKNEDLLQIIENGIDILAVDDPMRLHNLVEKRNNHH